MSGWYNRSGCLCQGDIGGENTRGREHELVFVSMLLRVDANVVHVVHVGHSAAQRDENSQ